MDITRSDVQGRARATKLADTDVGRAAEVAYEIRHPWYRCQALSSVAEVQPDKALAIKLIRDAFCAAEEQDDINRIVTVSSWPLKICVRLAPGMAEEKVQELVERASNEPHTLRRADALYAVLVAVKESASLKIQVLPAIVEALTLGHGWRIERLIANVALSVKDDHPEYIPKLLEVHRDNARKRKLLVELAGAASA